MISKRKAIVWAIVLVMFTSVTTFAVSNIIQVKITKDRLIVNKNQYENLVSFYQKYSKLSALEEFVKENYLFDVEEETLLDGEIKGLFQALGDPYSAYMSQEEFSDFMEHTKGSYSGIGIIVVPGEDNLITVVSPIEDTPGERVGLKPGDKIIKVNGKEYTADRMDEAVNVMKGKPGTEVTITILRKGQNGDQIIKDLTITREEIKQKTVKANMLDSSIGYIRITSFNEQTYEDFKKELNRLQKNNIKALIIDIRNNPGGLLDQCAKIADELIGEGIIVYTETKNGEREFLKSDKDKLEIPLAVLINEGSASASEILAGAVKDTKSGTLIGNKTFGKGIVQRIKALQDGSGFKLTVSSYYTPNGTNIHGKGIEPDISVKLPEDVEQVGIDNIEKDSQLKKAIEVLKGKID